uniref:WD_REPEATS_REGION domain-containing protein n=1 Tax=Trichobilharzia regenti TaxID=157069 RepID=A0AA85J0Q7_TRIRE|nr:unnamed protein product [Trichobilharzia regenti]
MARRHLESALAAGAFMEYGIAPCFRFTRIRFVRHCFPPNYDCPNKFAELTIDGNDVDDSDKLINERVNTYDNTYIVTKCNCFGLENLKKPLNDDDNDDLDRDTYIRDKQLIVSSGDCEDVNKHDTTACRLHMRDYLKRQPWRRLQDDYAIHAIQFSIDGKYILAGSANTSIRVIQTSDGIQRILPRPSKWTLGMPVTAIRFMPTKYEWAVACNSHGEVFSFQPDSEGFETLFTEPQQTYTLDMSPDGLELATGGTDRRIRIYALQPGGVIGLPYEITDETSYNMSKGYHMPGSIKRSLIETARNKNYEILNNAVERSRSNYPGGRPDQIVDITVKPYSVIQCYSTSETSQLSIHEPAAFYSYYQQQNPLAIPSLREYVATSPGINITEGHSMRIMALKYHPNKSAMLISAGWDNLVKIWDTRQQTGPVFQIYGPHIASPDGLDIHDNYLLTASWRGKQSLEIWDFRVLTSSTGKAKTFHLHSNNPSSLMDIGDYSKSNPPLSCRNPQEGPAEVLPMSGSVWGEHGMGDSGEYLYAARFLPCRAVVAGGSGFRQIRVIGRDTHLPIVRIPTDSVVQTIDTALDGRYVSAGCSSGTVTLIALA